MDNVHNVKVSIIIPIYNVSEYLRECIDSIIIQSLKDIEIILVNDGSNDGSEIIAKEYAERYKNIKLINTSHRGPGSARNKGLDVACGEYVYFLDSDDFLSNNAIERLYYISKENNLDQVRFEAYTFEDGTKNYQWSIDKNNRGYKYFGDYLEVMSGNNFYNESILNKDYFPSCCLIFSKREIIEKNKLRFIEGILHEDNMFNFSLTVLCDRVKVIHEPLYYRRYRRGSIMMGDRWLEKKRSMCVSAEEADKFIDTHRDTCEKIGRWLITFFIYSMIENWCKESFKEKYSDESKAYFVRVKPLIKKYKINNKSIKLFYFSPIVYSFIRKIFINI